MMKRSALLATFALSAALCMGCSNEDSFSDPISAQEALEFQKAAETKMEACEYKAAGAELEKIYNGIEMTTEQALERSIVGLMNIINEPHVQSLMPKFGFKSTDLNFFWQKDGFIDQVASDDINIEVTINKIKAVWLEDGSCTDSDGEHSKYEPVCWLDKNLTISDLLKEGDGIKDYLISLAKSMEIAADGLAAANKPGIIEQAGCGLNKLTFDAADLYLLAGAMRAAASGIYLAQAYDFDFKLMDIFEGMGREWYLFEKYDSEEERAKVLERAKAMCADYLAGMSKIAPHLLKLKDKNAAEPGRKELIYAASLFNKAAARGLKKPEKSFFGWQSFPKGSLEDVASVTQKFIDSNDGNKPIDLSGILSPTIKIDLKKIFDSPWGLEESLEPKCEYSERTDDGWIDVNFDYSLDGKGFLQEKIVEWINSTADKDILKIGEDEDGEPEIEPTDVFEMHFSENWRDFGFDEFLFHVSGLIEMDSYNDSEYYCETDADCLSGYGGVCLDNWCSYSVPPMLDCMIDVDCKDGYICNEDGMCIEGVRDEKPEQEIYGLEGDDCSEIPCSKWLYCDENKVCMPVEPDEPVDRPLGLEGDDCSDDYPCAAGLICSVEKLCISEDQKQPYQFVRILDLSPELSTEQLDYGADIDAVVLVKSNGYYSYAKEVWDFYNPVMAAVMSSNPDEMASMSSKSLGSPDSFFEFPESVDNCRVSIDQDPDNPPFVSLGGEGGYIVVEMEEEIENGDTLEVLEVGGCQFNDGPVGSETGVTVKEPLLIAVSNTPDLGWVILANEAEGPRITINILDLE